MPLLLRLGEDEAALQKAAAAHDPDLLAVVILKLYRSTADKPTLFKMLYAYPDALPVLKLYLQGKGSASTVERNILKSLFLYNKNYVDAGLSELAYGYSQPSKDVLLQSLKEAVTVLAPGRQYDALSLKSSTEEEIDLIDIHKTLTLRTNSMSSPPTWIGSSVTKTLFQLVLLSVQNASDTTWEKEAAKLIKKFKISEKTLWHIRLECFAQCAAWGEIAKLAAEKKSPIGYRPFALICIRYVAT